MQVADLYAKYQIMPQLVEHQLRVGGIAKLITDEWEDRAVAQECVNACLLHDMGNIVKFRGLTDPAWIAVQKEYHDKYGVDAHEATIGILMDAGLAKYAELIEEEKRLYEATPTERTIFEQYSKPAIVVLYADLRVMPDGVVSIEERTQDLIKRYQNKRTENIYGPPTEEYVQGLTSVEIAKITENDVQPLFDELLTVEIQ